MMLVNLILVWLTFTSGCVINKKAEDNTKNIAASVTSEATTNEAKYKDVGKDIIQKIKKFILQLVLIINLN